MTTGLGRPVGPLRGVRVLDLTDSSAVFATRILADTGCDVVRVEPPGGDPVRSLAPFLHDEPGPERSLPHLYLNAGKRSVVVDRATPAGQEAFWSLVTSADVIVETEGLSHAEVRRRNPAAIHVTVTPFGLDGPRTGWRATDLISAAAGGLAFLCGERDGPPLRPGADQAHKLAGLAAAAAAAIALAGRDRAAGQPGVHIELSVQDVVATSTLQTANPSYWAWHQRVPGRPGLGEVYQCADGHWITLAVRPNRRMAVAAWADQRGAGASADRAALRQTGLDAAALGSAIRNIVGSVTRPDLMAAIGTLDLMGLPVHSLSDLRTCEHLDAIAEFVAVPHDHLRQTLRFPRSPVGELATAGITRAPKLGEHNRQVLPALTADRPRDGSCVSQPDLDLSTALRGIRVVDFCWMIAGPLGTRLLADFGAEVIRVEAGPRAYPDTFPPGTDDPSLGAYHNSLNTQKRSVTIDPRRPEGRELLLDLIATADVVTNNYRPPAFEKLGFDDKALRERNPRLINLHMPGTGRTGPWSRIGTFGTMVAAAAGLNYLTGRPGTPPRGLGVAYSDFTTPFLVPLMIVAALRQRDRSGQGMELELNQLAATVSLVGVEWLALDSSGITPPRPGNRDRNLCPHGIYPARGDDEWVAIAAGAEDFGPLCSAIGHPELADQLPTAAARAAAEDELDGLIAHWTSTRDKWAAAAELQAAGVPSAPVENLRDAMESDERLARRHYLTIEQPSHPGITVPIQNTPIQTAGEPRAVRRAPMYGEDNDYVLQGILRRSAADVLALRQAGVIG
jgi:crotonobetainyl-CoA:carnitine CoA-transferase CaiB-like acyl-CoA transferase